MGQLDATATVNVQNAPIGAKLDAWIDFNGDGSFGGPGEQIADTVDVVAGDNVIEFDVPSWAASGETYARFRLSTTGNLASAGAAADGEVEDHYVIVMSPSSSSGEFAAGKPIAPWFSDPRSVYSADVDDDGDMDVVAGCSRTVAWYENDGIGSFASHTISISVSRVTSVFAADMDGDGDMDVLSASYWDNKIAWYENDGAEYFTGHTIATSADAPGSVFAADVDGDGDMDALSASSIDDKIAWYENDGQETFTAHTISTSANYAESVFAADVDSDGDLDVLSASGFDDTIAWYENDGSERFAPHAITTSADNAKSVYAADLDGDGDVDVLSVFDNWPREVVWYENDGAKSFAEHAISSSAAFARSAVAADIDGDGDLDVLTASTNGMNDDRIAWYQNVDAVDYGDAPATYSTTLNADGARHEMAGPTLGAIRDADPDGQPTIDANGDDQDSGGDDEDAVTFNSLLFADARDVELTVNVQDAPDGAKLDAWIDFNANGTFESEEQIAVSLGVAEGDNLIRFNVPETAVVGTSYTRFRLSTAGSLEPTGAADDGEVEDYLLTIFAANLNVPHEVLGAVDFRELPSIDVSGGTKGYFFTLANPGYLTIDGFENSTGETGTIRLLNVEGDILAEATGEGYLRLERQDLNVGETYVLQASGTSPDIDLKICNLVEQTDRTVTVRGTDSADQFEYLAAETHQISINGVPYHFAPTEIDTIAFDGGPGANEAVLTGSTAVESATFYPGHGSMTTTETGFTVSVENTPHITANSGGGLDTVQLVDSDGDDTLVATPTQITMSGTPAEGTPYSLTANNFRYAHGYAKNGGNDTAQLTGSENTERIKPYTDFVKLIGSGYFNRTKFFETNTVDTLGGTDNGVMMPSTTADAVWAMKNDIRIARDVTVPAGESPDYDNLTYDVTIANCEYFLARASGNDDWLEFHDSTGNDVLLAKPHKIQIMNGPDPDAGTDRGSEYKITARGFHHVTSVADQGGDNDSAKLYDSAEDGVDTWAAAYVDGQTWSTMASPTRLLYEVLAFEHVGGYGYNGGLGEDHGTNRKQHDDDVDFVFQYGYWENP